MMDMPNGTKSVDTCSVSGTFNVKHFESKHFLQEEKYDIDSLIESNFGSTNNEVILNQRCYTIYIYMKL